MIGEPYDIMRVIYPMRVFQQWYKGDGVYGDGAMFHWDYYNSFVDSANVCGSGSSV